MPARTATPTPTPTPAQVTGVALPKMAKVADLPGGHVSAIAFAPSDPSVVYLASNVNAMGVWRSDDAGESWRRVYDENFGAGHTNTLAIHPGDPQNVLIGDFHGRITKTSDGGEQWTVVYERESPIFALAISISQPDVVYAGDGEGNVFKSTNGGQTWTALSTVAPEAIGSLAVDPGTPDTLYAGASDGVYKSTDGGLTWRKVFPPEGEAMEVVEMAVAPARPDLLLAATRQGVFRSADGGGSWQRALDRHAHSVKVAPIDPRVVYAGTTNGVYRSDDAGVSWTRNSSGIQYLDIGPLTVHPEDPNVVLVGSKIWQWTFHFDPFPSSTEGEGIFKTTDGGAFWKKRTSGFLDADVIAVAADPNDPNVVYVGMECSRGIFRSEDGGDSWVFIPGGPNDPGSFDIAHYTMRLAVDSSSNVYLTGRSGFAKSTDRGQHWTEMLIRRHFHGIGISPHDSQFIFVGTSPNQDPTATDDYPGGRILRSTNGGLSWQEAEAGFPSDADTSVHDFAFDAEDTDVIYVSTSRHEIHLPRTSATVGIYRSADGGLSWTAANEGLPTLDVDSLAASPTTPGLLHAGTEQGIFRSVDGGANWTATSVAESVRSLLVDPTDSDSIFAGTEAGLFWSRDGGVSWQRMDSVPAESVTSLTMDAQGRVLYATVNDVGVFKGVKP